MVNEQEQIVQEFLVEAFESLDRVDQELVALENDPHNKQLLNSIFRAVHTFKGTCGFLEFKKLEAISHVGENLLDSLRAGRLVLDGRRTSVLLELMDAIRKILSSVSATGTEGDGDYAALIEKLVLAATDQPLNAPEPSPAGAAPVTATPPTLEQAPAEAPIATDAPSSVDSPHAGAAAPGSAAIKEGGATTIVDDIEAVFRAAQQEYSMKNAEPPAKCEAPVIHATTVSSPEAPPAPEPMAAVAPTEQKEGNSSTGPGVADSSLRVDVALLDQLMNLVGELVLARNQILQFTKTLHDSTLVSTSQRLNLITSELQEGVMRTRMQPISNVWSKFPRIIRDVSRACGKQVRLDMEGKETDLDKTIIESIKDPLTHLVRNSIDHGIETPEIRKSRGKNPEGRLLLRAYHEGGHVMIEISDDGGGLNTEKIRAKALERGLVTAEKASRMSDSEVNRLIFLPGFSTADAVTNISGRGVGMDVVRSNIERIGGVVDLASTLGHGTTIKIKIPLTLAIVPALIVSLMGQRYAIPQVSLLELVRVQEKDFAKTIENIHGAEFYRLRGNLLPLVYLDTELKLRSMDKVSERNLERGLNIVVVRADTKVVGLVVDAVHDTEEIVVKPLSKQLKSLAVFAGATIMGDGCVALILDVLGIARKAGVLGDESIKEDQKDGSGSGDADKSGEVEKESLLIVELAKGGRGAIQLSMVNRLEEFQSSTIENAAGRSVVQYREGILPLVDLRRIYGLENSRLPERIPVVVYQHGDQLVGCIVSRILDIVEERIVVQFPGSREGVRGAMVIQKLVTDLIDLDAAMKIERCVAPQLSVQGNSEAGALV